MPRNRSAYGLFLGCLIPLRLPFIESSTREIFKKINIRLVDILGASCCPAPGIIKKVDKIGWITIAARNLALAEKMNMNIMTLCNGCLLTLAEVNMMLKKDKTLLSHINGLLTNQDLEYKGRIEVYHFIDIFIDQIGLNQLKSTIIKPLTNLKIFAFYGCHYLSYRKNILQLNQAPQHLEKLIELTGATCIDYLDKWGCCGAGEGVRSASPTLSKTIGKEKIFQMQQNAITNIVNICPFCHLQLTELRNSLKTNLNILHYSQLLGLAMAIPPHRLGLNTQILSKIN